MPLNVLLLGPQGAGKGTQAKRIAVEYDIPHIASGEILRAEMRAGSELGHRVKDVIDRGDLVSDDLMIELIKSRLAQADTDNGFILDGFPRTRAQAEALAAALHPHGTSLHGALLLEVPDDEAVRRLSGRRTCPRCGRVYHVEFEPPQREGHCDVDREELVQRDDDRPDTVRHRLRVYHDEIGPLLSFYADAGLVHRVDASGTPDEVAERLEADIKELMATRR